MNNFYENALQNAALIASIAAVVLFIIKEVIDYIRRKQERENNKKAADRVASMQMMRILANVLFILRLIDIAKSAPDKKSGLEIVDDGYPIIFKNDELLLPMPVEMINFSYEVILAVAKIDNSKFVLYSNMHNAIIQLDTVIKHIDCSIKKYGTVDCILDNDNVLNLIDKIIEIVDKINEAMLKNGKYESFIEEIREKRKSLI
ncbi:hypothetical protein N0G65_000152 [Providencia rettgeri]|nr:hypothetical protein [Providencia rettgeri]